MTKLKLPVLKCLRCGHEWFPRKPEKPLVCPGCNSPYWDRPRQRAKPDQGDSNLKEVESIPRQHAQKCSWCGKPAEEIGTTISVMVNLPNELSKYYLDFAGRAVLIPLGDRKASCLIATMDSLPRQKGFDGVFICCSKGCADELVEALKNDNRGFNVSGGTIQ